VATGDSGEPGPALPSELRNGHPRRILITISCGKARFEEIKIETASVKDFGERP